MVLAQHVVKEGEEGTHEVRWFSGRMARWIWEAALVKFVEGERGLGVVVGVWGGKGGGVPYVRIG